jgi:hypothetical protein
VTGISCDRFAGPVSTGLSQPVTNLAQLHLTGVVTASGDGVVMTTPSSAYGASGSDMGAVNGWDTAEFNVFGDGNGGRALFAPEADVQPRILITSSGKEVPACIPKELTAETNNLDFASPAPVGSTPGPAMIFHEASGGKVQSMCGAATSVGG